MISRLVVRDALRRHAPAFSVATTTTLAGLPEPRQRIRQLAGKEVTPLTLGQFRAASCVGAELHVLLMNAAWVHSELSVRMAKIYRQLERLPHGLAEQPSVRHVRGLYGSYVAQLLETKPPTTATEEVQFRDMLRGFKKDSKSIVPLVSSGLLELADNAAGSGSIDGDCETLEAEEERLLLLQEMSEALDHALLARIGVRMLITQFCEREREIIERVDPHQVTLDAVAGAAQLCERDLGVAAETCAEWVEVRVVQRGYGRSEGSANNVHFTYVRDHLQHMLTELIKNSMSAIWSQQLELQALYEKPMRIIISQGHEDVTIKVSDRGGGIKRSQMPLLWLYTPDRTVWEGRRLLRGLPRRPVHGGEGAAGATVRGHFEGGGWGLPMSRNFARYFGGDLRIISVEGYGTDAFIQLNRLANQPESLSTE